MPRLVRSWSIVSAVFRTSDRSLRGDIAPRERQHRVRWFFLAVLAERIGAAPHTIRLRASFSWRLRTSALLARSKKHAPVQHSNMTRPLQVEPLSMSAWATRTGLVKNHRGVG